MIKKMDHIAIAVKDAEKAAKFYAEQLGIPVTHVQEIAFDKVKVAFIPVGDSEIELVEPMDPQGGVATFIERKGEGLHHICFEVDNIDSEIKSLTEKGVQMIDKQARKGAAGMVAFIHPKSTGGVLIELAEKV
ncbi:MAG: methylmalonyl-CoA epimerase [Dehalococcoidia bacterium]|nr:methylmalonyl-CoA epimerase [Dehalococcoidia bacterium]